MSKNKGKIRILDVPYLYLDRDLFEDDIEKVAKNVLNIKSLLKKEYEEREKSIKNETFTPFEKYQYIYLDFYISDGIEFDITVYRDETDLEQKERLKKDKEYNIQLKRKQIEIKEKQEKEEKILFEKLKQKYG